MPAHCRACLLTCMDFRLREPIERFLVEHRLDRDGVDVVRLAGVAKNISRPSSPHHRQIVLEQFRTSASLHDIKEIYLVNHEDCGAYGLEDVADSDEELQVHKDDLQAAQDLLTREFPDLAVKTYFLRLDGRFEFCG